MFWGQHAAGTLVAAAERGSQWQKAVVCCHSKPEEIVSLKTEHSFRPHSCQALSLIQDVPHLQVNIVAFNAVPRVWWESNPT